MRVSTLFCAATLSMLMAGSADATTAQELLSACRPVASAEILHDGVKFPHTFDTGLCWATLDIIQKMIVHLDDSNRLIYSVCAPPTSTLTQLVAVFVVFAERNPQRLHEAGLNVALDSLRVAFPCKPPKP